MRKMFALLELHYVKSLGKSVWLQFTGGEPTMHPEIIPLLTDASKRGFKVSLISNGSRTLRFWERAAPLLNAAILTYHSEFVDHAHFLAVAGRLAEDIPVHVNVTLPTDGFDAVFASAEEIGKEIPTISLSLKPLREGFGHRLYPYSPDQLRKLETRITHPDRRNVTLPRTVMVREFANGDYDVRRANELIVSGQNNWKGLICSAGLESLRIHGNGKITRAVCGVGGTIGQLGSIKELPTGPVICSRSACSCVADILITKRQPCPPVAAF